jgi:hypothetical protein
LMPDNDKPTERFERLELFERIERVTF